MRQFHQGGLVRRVAHPFASVPSPSAPDSMRLPFFATSIALLVTAACAEKTPVEPVPTFHLNATVAGSGTCDVDALAKTYQSTGQQRGDTGEKFVGTLATETYHGVGCWVGTTNGDGDIIVIFSGNSLGQPLAVGTYQLSREILDDTPLMRANVTFRNSDMPGSKLVTLDNAVGTVVVDSTSTGERIIRANVEVTRWSPTI